MIRTLQARIRVGSPTGNVGPRKIEFTVEDRASGIETFFFEMSPEDFALLLVGNGSIEQEVNYRIDLLGYKSENKRIEIPEELIKRIKPVYDEHRERKLIPEDRAYIFGPYEKDGWKCSDRDLFNSHNRKPGEDGWVQSVSMSRWVSVETGEPYLEKSK